MFTGLIEALGRVAEIRPLGGGLRLAIDVAGLRKPPAPGASVAVDGACLTVTALEGDHARFDAVSESIARTTLGALRAGDEVHLESALRAGEPLDGHLVQGHVDAVGTLLEMRRLPESRIARLSLPREIEPLVAEKGSVAVHGVSLTVVDVAPGEFSVSLIPETLERTMLGRLSPGAKVNLEADLVARHLARLLATGAAGGADSPGLTPERLRDLGY
jgi:riboflavin synthase